MSLPWEFGVAVWFCRQLSHSRGQHSVEFIFGHPVLVCFHFRKSTASSVLLCIYVYDILWWHLLNAVTLRPRKYHINAEKCVIVQHSGRKEFAVQMWCRSLSSVSRVLKVNEWQKALYLNCILCVKEMVKLHEIICLATVCNFC